MPVIFPGGQIDINTARVYLSQGSGDVRYLMSITGNSPADAFSDWWYANFYGDLYLEQGEGYIWDGCQGRDAWTWMEVNEGEYGGYINAWGGPSTYNTERGYNNGTFLTFGYGYCTVRARPYTGVMVASASSNDYNCRAFYVDVYEFGYGVRTGNYFAYAGGYQEIRYYFNIGFQQGRSFIGRLILWY
jgi:hypothetical protein